MEMVGELDAGPIYLQRRIPIDPMTKSADTWVVEFEEPDPDFDDFDFEEELEPGIVNIYSGSTRTSLDGEAYADW